MTNREKVIKGLECCQHSSKSHCNGCPYFYDGLCSTNDCTADLASDALALLKEQEPVEPIPPTDESDLWKCGNCNHQLFRCTQQRYCSMCGRQVKWDG